LLARIAISWRISLMVGVGGSVNARIKMQIFQQNIHQIQISAS
jgi:hypothetical protein